ncbi:CBU_0592 family membrane protein [Desulfovibrio inopinatus]|uniref:CBU_0592 family membrane protein n=1 Tax=Desulfovibrio inopinatus TaxID=102109 RepID=UPI0004870816|nr:hypothetical protein [Desulfovibrio inopinatus]
MNTISWYDVVGVAGSITIVATYLLLQTGRMSSKTWPYSALNLVGAAAILLSLVHHFNLAACVIEGFWLLISIYGLQKSLRLKTPATAQAPTDSA